MSKDNDFRLRQSGARYPSRTDGLPQSRSRDAARDAARTAPRAIYSLSLRSIGRSTHRAGFAAAHARYILRDGAVAERLGRVPAGYDLSRESVAAWLANAERADRSNARVCDRIIIAIPRDLGPQSYATFVNGFRDELGLDRVGWVAAIHARGDDAENPHAHIIVRDRDFDTGKRVLQLSEKGSVERVREAWERAANNVLERAGSDQRVDRRTLAEQGIDRAPQIHVGPRAEAIAAKELNSHLRTLNELEAELELVAKEIAERDRRLPNEITIAGVLEHDPKFEPNRSGPGKHAVLRVRETVPGFSFSRDGKETDVAEKTHWRRVVAVGAAVEPLRWMSAGDPVTLRGALSPYTDKTTQEPRVEIRAFAAEKGIASELQREPNQVHLQGTVTQVAFRENRGNAQLNVLEYKLETAGREPQTLTVREFGPNAKDLLSERAPGAQLEVTGRFSESAFQGRNGNTIRNHFVSTTPDETRVLGGVEQVHDRADQSRLPIMDLAVTRSENGERVFGRDRGGELELEDELELDF